MDSSGDKKHQAEKVPGSGAETVFQVFVYGHQFQAAEEGKEHHHDENHGQGHRQFVLKPGESPTRSQGDIGGDTDEGIGRR